MARILYSYLCWGLKRDEQNGILLPHKPFERFGWSDSPVLFTCLVCWTGRIGERFSQSFALVDERGHVLDEMPEMDCELTSHHDTVSAAFFYAILPRSGRYYINIFQDGICMEGIPLDAIEAPAPATV